jgi:hypothetical protein
MDKKRYDRILNLLFILLVVFTFFNLYYDIIWLSYVLAVSLLVFVALHIRDFKFEKPKSKKVFVLTLIISINFLLANAVIVISEFVYPY